MGQTAVNLSPAGRSDAPADQQHLRSFAMRHWTVGFAFLCRSSLHAGIALFYVSTFRRIYVVRIKIHSSCEIEDVSCKLCDTPIARVTGCVSSLRIWVGDSP